MLLLYNYSFKRPLGMTVRLENILSYQFLKASLIICTINLIRILEDSKQFSFLECQISDTTVN